MGVCPDAVDSNVKLIIGPQGLFSAGLKSPRGCLLAAGASSLQQLAWVLIFAGASVRVLQLGCQHLPHLKMNCRAKAPPTNCNILGRPGPWFRRNAERRLFKADDKGKPMFSEAPQFPKIWPALGAGQRPTTGFPGRGFPGRVDRKCWFGEVSR